MNTRSQQNPNAVLTVISTNKPYLTPKEVSDTINISVGTLAVWRTTKKYEIPYLKVGGKVLYPVSGLNQWLSSRTYNNQRA